MTAAVVALGIMLGSPVVPAGCDWRGLEDMLRRVGQ